MKRRYDTKVLILNFLFLSGFKDMLSDVSLIQSDNGSRQSGHSGHNDAHTDVLSPNESLNTALSSIQESIHTELSIQDSLNTDVSIRKSQQSDTIENGDKPVLITPQAFTSGR